MRKHPHRHQAQFACEQMAMLPFLSQTASWPQPATQPGLVLARLLTGERLTQPSYGLRCWRLAAYIKELKYAGWPIEAMNVPCPAGAGTGKRPIREYWLPQWALAALAGARRTA